MHCALYVFMKRLLLLQLEAGVGPGLTKRAGLKISIPRFGYLITEGLWQSKTHVKS